MACFNNKNNNSSCPLSKGFWKTLLIILVSFSVGYLYSSYHWENSPQKSFSPNNVNGSTISSEVDFNLYWEVWHKLKEEYVDRNQISEQEMFYGSLRGLTASLKDPYTVFLDPIEVAEFKEDLSGTFEGIGAEVGIRDDLVTVIAPLEGMPAQQAGVRAGDKIYAINGESTIGLTINEAVRKIRGPKDTEVTLTLLREDEDQPLEITITRGIIVVKSVSWEKRDDDLFVIRISNFHDDTLYLFNQAIMEVLANNPRGIILDLRNNPGGYLDTAVEVASEWVKEGPVVAEQMSAGRRNEYFASGQARLHNIPTVVLVNQGSASASEIVAGALRDYKQGVIIGEQTFGKGSVQTLSDLSDGSSLKITVGKWLTPAGDFINEKGIEPDIIIELTREDFLNDLDPQFEKAVDTLLNW